MILYKMCIEPARDKSRMAHYKIPKSKGRLHSCNPVLTYGSDHPGDGLLPATPMNYKLGNHWIIIDRSFHAVFITIVNPRSEEHTNELQSLMRHSSADFH